MAVSAPCFVNRYGWLVLAHRHRCGPRARSSQSGAGKHCVTAFRTPVSRRRAHIAGTIRPLILALDFFVALATMLLESADACRVAVAGRGERGGSVPAAAPWRSSPDPRRGRRVRTVALVRVSGTAARSDAATGAPPNQCRAQRVPRPLTCVESGRPIRLACVHWRRRDHRGAGAARLVVESARLLNARTSPSRRPGRVPSATTPSTNTRLQVSLARPAPAIVDYSEAPQTSPRVPPQDPAAGVVGNDNPARRRARRRRDLHRRTSCRSQPPAADSSAGCRAPGHDTAGAVLDGALYARRGLAMPLAEPTASFELTVGRRHNRRLAARRLLRLQAQPSWPYGICGGRVRRHELALSTIVLFTPSAGAHVVAPAARAALRRGRRDRRQTDHRRRLGSVQLRPPSVVLTSSTWLRRGR